MKRRPAVLGAAFLCTFGAAALGHWTPASAAETGGLAVHPATFDPNDPATRAYFKPVVTPGGTFSGAVVVSNTSDAPLSAYVYPVDGATSQTAGAVYLDRSDPITKAGRWVTVPSTTLTLAPHSETQVPFTVSVPANAVSGDHLAGIAVENQAAQTASSSGSNFTVNEIIRAVVGVSIKVPGPAAFAPTAGQPKVEQLAGTGNAVVRIPLTDTGLALGKPTLDVTVSGPDAYHRTVTRALDTLLPGDTIDYPFIWPDDLAQGHYTATVAIEGQTGPGAIATGSSDLGATLDGASAPGAAKQVVIVRAPAGIPRSMALGLVGALAALALAGGLVIRTLAARRRPLGLV